MSAKVRQNLLKKLSKRTHRYGVYRFLTQSTTLALLFLIPLSKLAQFDFWRGQHYSLGEPVSTIEGLAAVIAGIASLYVITFVANALCGRLFCGWGCPLAQLSRFGESLRTGGRSVQLQGALFAALLVAGVMVWWVDPRVLVEGSPTAIAVTSATFVALFALTYLHGKVFRWGFCQKACPIGLYYSIVATDTSHGIIFESELGTCKGCDLCDRICPVELHPRALVRTRAEVGGLSVDGFPEDNHCLRCGDCVQACELVFDTDRRSSVPLHFGFGNKGVPLHPRPSEIEAHRDAGSAQREREEGCVAKAKPQAHHFAEQRR